MSENRNEIISMLEKFHAQNAFSQIHELCMKALIPFRDDRVFLWYKEQAEQALTSMYESKIGNLKKSIALLKSPMELTWLKLEKEDWQVIQAINGEKGYLQLCKEIPLSKFLISRSLSRLIQQQVVSTS